MTIVSTGSLTLKDLNDAKQLSMFIGASQSRQVIYDGVSAYTPNYSTNNQVLTPQLRIAGGGSDVSSGATATRWYYQTGGAGAVTQITVSGGGYTLSTGSQPITLTITTNILASQTSMNYICEMDYVDPDTGFTVTSKADIQVIKVTNGSSSFTAIVSNENVTLPSDNAGNVSSYTGSGTDIQVYDGTTALTYDGVGTSNGTFKVTPTATNITVGAVSGSGTNKATYAVSSAMVVGSDTANISFAIVGKTSAGASINITKIQTFSKSKLGQNATAYSLSMPTAFQKNALGAYVSTTATIKAFSQTGSATPIAYNGFIYIETTADGTTWAQSVANTTQLASGSYTYTVPASIKAFRVKLYTTTGGVGQVDEQTCYIVQDGTNSIYAKVWTPSGNAIQNSVGSIDVLCDIYDGVNMVNGSAFKWYVQDPSATTSSGGDADGLNGWRLINTVANPTTSPTVTAPVTSGSTLTATTYYIKYTWVGLTGETIGNTTQITQAITAGQGLNIVVPTFPTGVTGANVYVGTVTGDANLKFQGQIATSAGTLLIKTPIQTTTVLIPTTSTAVSTNATLTVQAFAVQGMESFKCVVTYNSVKYANVTTVQDLSDPIKVDITGVDTFKNGIGTTKLTAVLWRGGAEIDQTGTLYTYSWSVYDSTGALVTTTYSTLNTGKTVTVDGRDINARANIICQISQ